MGRKIVSTNIPREYEDSSIPHKPRDHSPRPESTTKKTAPTGNPTITYLDPAPKPPPTRGDIRNNLVGAMASAMIPETIQDPEGDMVDAIDEKRLLLDILNELAPIYKRAKDLHNPEDIIQMGGRIAALTQLKLLISNDKTIQERVANRILDRSMGKPVERKMTINADLNRMSEKEADREIARIFRKLGSEASGEILKILGSPGKDNPAPQPDAQGTEV